MGCGRDAGGAQHTCYDCTGSSCLHSLEGLSMVCIQYLVDMWFMSIFITVAQRLPSNAREWLQISCATVGQAQPVFANGRCHADNRCTFRSSPDSTGARLYRGGSPPPPCDLERVRRATRIG